MLVEGLHIEADAYIAQAQTQRGADGRRMVVGNGLSQERTVQTTIGTVTVRQPRVHDRRDGERFTSAILLPYVRHTMEIDAMVAVLYLLGVSMTRMETAPRSIVGEGFEAMSAAAAYRSSAAHRTTDLYLPGRIQYDHDLCVRDLMLPGFRYRERNKLRCCRRLITLAVALAPVL